MESAAPEVPEATAAPDVPATEAAAAEIENWRDAAFLDHMHAHAEQLDDLNYALDDGDLERAMTPAYWLSRHKTVRNLPEELQPFADRMREAARAVEEAGDIETARAAADRISAECQSCHSATGVVTE